MHLHVVFVRGHIVVVEDLATDRAIVGGEEVVRHLQTKRCCPVFLVCHLLHFSMNCCIVDFQRRYSGIISVK